MGVVGMDGGLVGILALIAMTLAIWAAVELSGRIRATVAIVMFPALSCVVAVAWAIQGVGTPFLFAKILSVGLAASLIVWLAQDWRGSTSRWGAWLAILMLGLNIAEAVAAESLTHISPNFFAGILLIAALPGPAGVSANERASAGTDFRYGVSWLWVCAYTVWNFAFVYGTAAPGKPLAEFAGLAFLHLGAPLLASWGRADRWAQARTFSLALTFIALPNAETPVDTQNWYDPQVASVLGGLALVLAPLALGKRAMALRAK